MGKRIMLKKVIFCFLIILSFTCVSSAGIIDELKSGQEKIKSVESQFVQEQNTKLLSKPIKSTGRFIYKQPDKIRWEYKGSVNMLVVYDGRELWIYYPELKEADRLDGIPQYSSMMHFDISRLSRDYKIIAFKKNNLLRLSCIPIGKSLLRRIEMDFLAESSFPFSVKLTDLNEVVTSIIFKDIRINPDISDDMFRFSPDKETTVRERTIK